MNQKEETEDTLPEVEMGTFKPLADDQKVDAEGGEISASTQIVEDISSSPEEVVQSIFPDFKPETVNEASPDITEVPEAKEIVETPAPPPVSAAPPSETGVYQLLNAMVDRPYRVEIDLKELKIETALISRDFEGQFEKLGLSATRDGNVFLVEGNPTADTQGEHTLCLDYSYNNEGRVHRKKFTLLINPDPKSLWKNLEPDEKLQFRKEHTAIKQISGQSFNIIAASRRGRSHAHEAKFREDDFAVHAGENGWHILIVADGAGSAALSREGSRLACQTGLESLKRSITELFEPKFNDLANRLLNSKTETTEKEIKNLLYQVLCGAAFEAYKKLEQESGASGIPLKDYSTTLLISIVKKLDKGTFVAAFGIGDGAIGALDGYNKRFELMNIPDGGEFSGQTRFLTMREVIGDGSEMLRRIKFSMFENLNGLFLMTDGISDPKFGTDKNLLSLEKWLDFGAELSKEVNFDMKNENAARELLDYMDFWSPGEHDDRTLAILY